MNSKKKERHSFSLEKIFSSPITCYLCPFIFIGGYLIYCVASDQIYHAVGYYLIHYLYVYDHGFIPRGLVGEVISWFTDFVSDETTYQVVLCFSVFLMISSSLCIGKALSKVRNDKIRFYYVFSIITILCVLPITFKEYFDDIKLDKLLWALTLLAVFLVTRKYGIWIVPVLCVLATLVNPVFLFCSMILIAIILLQEFYARNYSVKNGIICVISYISMISVGVYGVISERQTNFATPEDFVDYYFSRYIGHLSEETYELFTTEWLFDYFNPINEILKKSFNIYFIEWECGIETILHFTFVALPAYFLLTLFWKKVIKNETNMFQKFIFFLCAISPVVIIPPVLLSWEFSKYFYNNLLVQACLVVYFIVRDTPAIMNTLNSIIDKGKKHIVLTAAVIVYFSSISIG